MMELSEKKKVEIIVKLSKSYNLAILMVFIFILLFVFNQQTNQNDRCNPSNQPIQEHDRNLFKCYESTKNMSNYFKSFGINKPTLDSLHAYLARKDMHSSFEISSQKWIIDKYYHDIQAHKYKVQFINNSIIEKIQQLFLDNTNYNPFDDIYLEKMLRKHLSKKSHFANNRIGIINWFEKEYWPWIESLLLLNGAQNIVNIDLNKKSYESNYIKSLHLNDYLENRLDSYRNNLNALNEHQFDVLISRFSMEEIGLGKYGEDISFNADLDMSDMMNCMLKNNGLLFVYLTVNESEDKSVIQFNTKRVYGKTRLNELFLNSNSNWFLIDRLTYKHGSEELFVLKKRLAI